MAKLGAALVCLLFALPFGGVGVGASWVLGRMIYDGHRAEEWVRVKATVDSYDRGSVNYRYRFGGVEYQGDRLGANPIGGTDDVDSWHDDMAAMLSSAKAEGKPITVWVNPDKPSESMVDRTIRWKLAMFIVPFAFGFGGVGLGAVWMFLRTLFRSPAEVKEQPDPLAARAIAATVKAIRAKLAPASIEPVVRQKAPVNDGVFARGLIDAPPAGGASGMIDTTDVGMPPPPDAATAEIEKLSGRKLGNEQREQLAKLTPKQREMIAKAAGWLGKIKQTQD
jgi:hypothetical protein